MANLAGQLCISLKAADFAKNNFFSKQHSLLERLRFNSPIPVLAMTLKIKRLLLAK